MFNFEEISMEVHLTDFMTKIIVINNLNLMKIRPTKKITDKYRTIGSLHTQKNIYKCINMKFITNYTIIVIYIYMNNKFKKYIDNYTVILNI